MWEEEIFIFVHLPGNHMGKARLYLALYRKELNIKWLRK